LLDAWLISAQRGRPAAGGRWAAALPDAVDNKTRGFRGFVPSGLFSLSLSLRAVVLPFASLLLQAGSLFFSSSSFFFGLHFFYYISRNTLYLVI
jgi:hypothetical protein